MNVVRSLLFYLVFYTGSVIFSLTAYIVALIVPKRVRPVPDTWSRFHRLCLGIVGIKVREIGPRHPGPALYAIKHESFFEAIDAPNTLDFPVPFGKEELFKIPGWGYAAKTYGAVTVMRDQGAKGLRAMLAEARTYTDSGRPLVIFPEGTRIPHGKKPPLQSGFAGLYKMLGLPVIPVAVDSGPLYHRWWKRPGTITLQFFEPIAPGLPREEIEARVHAAINALNS